MKRRLWWVASNKEELDEWKQLYFNNKHCEIIEEIALPEDGERTHVVFSIEQSMAHSVLGYIPEESEWLND